MSSAQSTTKSSGDLTTSDSVSGFAKAAFGVEHHLESRVTWDELDDRYGYPDVVELARVIPKGRKLYDQMIKQPPQPVESKWQAGMSPEDFGYTEVMYIAQDGCNSVSNMLLLDKLLELMGFQTGFTLGSPENADKLAESEKYQDIESELDPGPNTIIGHHLEFNGKQAEAIWHQIVNEDAGLLIAWGNWSPTGLMLRKRPDLAYWSDVAFLQWKMCTSENAQLKYVLQHDVINSTVITVNNIITSENSAGKDTEWPGITYSTETVEGQTLLGTPNGSGVAFMLIQHRKALGHKKVDKVTVFDFEGRLIMLFHIIDVIANVTDKTVSKESQSDRLDEDETDEDEDYETDSSDEPASEKDVEEPPTDDDDEVMADEDYVYESDESDEDNEDDEDDEDF